MADERFQGAAVHPPTKRRTSIYNKEYFHQYFHQQSSQLLEQIERLHEFSLVGGERQDAIEHVLGGITDLSNYVADASDQISSYDKRVYSDGIRILEEKLRVTQSSIAPNSKFKFVSRLKDDFAPASNVLEDLSLRLTHGTPQGLETASPGEVSNVTGFTRSPDEKDSCGELPLFPRNYNQEISKADGVRKPSFSQATKIDLSDHKDMHIILPPPASRATSMGTVTKLSGSIVDMSIPTTTKTPFASLVIKDIRNCLIVGGQVAGSAHITSVMESIIAVSAGQIRIHDCEDMKFYLYSTSPPIIENCTNIQFAPLPKCYLGPDQDLDANKWDQVQDFNWQKTEHSPNWRILPEEDRLAENIWTDVVPGQLGVGLVETKSKIGLK